ncbi:Major facilitator superfamily domain general substrate transporter [Penicillium concentricum]|uniref:Major facilitator superfamily domain general substrate transporter n=1 Tax=Penicillium concentricum TaxID=293559 RepID=A0A9W9S8P1_9EURO|nr:Major facilitator superfamily domain general substrate transporter [Penicillium concentricum]KAJ5372664.1 Major facilitator superfamily domain general substrate transporter [Penicillium concentricum]
MVSPAEERSATMEENSEIHPVVQQPAASRWRRVFGRKTEEEPESSEDQTYRAKSTLGILSDKETDEVPGTVLLLSSNRNEPLGMRHQPHRTSTSSISSSYRPSRSNSRTRSTIPTQKRTADGQFVLDPQPDDSVNDPLNWPVWQRDTALVSLGFYCLMGGGMTPILAAGFNNVATEYNVSTQQVAFTTGFYMLGLGLGSVVMSPTAILYGKRPVYLLGATLFVISAIWCAASPNYPSLVVARIFQGFAVSPVECLPSATIAEIYFLHERAYRVGIYTLLLLGGKNLIPLVSAAIIEGLSWRWVFWIVAMIVGMCLVLLFFFVPETFWDRTPRPRVHKNKSPRITGHSVSDLISNGFRGRRPHVQTQDESVDQAHADPALAPKKPKHTHVGFADDHPEDGNQAAETEKSDFISEAGNATNGDQITTQPPTPANEKGDDFLQPLPHALVPGAHPDDLETGRPAAMSPARTESLEPAGTLPATLQYTNRLRERPKIPFSQLLRVWNGRIAQDSWFRVAVRPFVLFAYPSVLWSTVVYSLSVGWLIVLSESVAHIFEGKEHYHFTALQTGLVYISPFVGGLLGTAVAGKVSDIIARFMTRRNGGIYEPEFRLVMALPIALSTVIGLMAFGWSAEIGDSWIVPTIFFGLISFGCCLGSTTAITFCVDSYRQYAGEALVTLNFSKNILHGLIFSLFIVDWLDADGSRTVFLSIGGIQLFFMLMSIPMYIYGKRARMWTVRKRLMERL